MATVIQDASSFQVRVEVLRVRDGRRLKRMRPDEDGYFVDVPIAALGIATRNNTYYDVPTFHRELTDPKSMFCTRLSGGQLYGELGHPDIAGMSKELAFARLMDIQEKNWSHHFRSVQTKGELEGGGTLLCADIKPTGNGKDTVQENFEDPYMNTAFSLRSITSAVPRGELSFRQTKKLITFDFVGAGGYFEASKLFTPSMECFDLDITGGLAILSECSMENFTDTELNELFGTNKIQMQTFTRSVAEPVLGKRFSRYDGDLLMSNFRTKFK